MGKSWISPTDCDGTTDWDNCPNAYDDNEATNAHDKINDREWSGWLTLGYDDVICNAVRINASYCARCTTAQVEIYSDGTWTQIYSGDKWSGWKTIEFSEATISKMRYRIFNANFTYTCDVYVAEADFYGELPGVQRWDMCNVTQCMG
ncbi:MAG: hypothetical protein KKF27_20195 [Gammaproteobacteria bacterium]|nr:hypothetical protein [Gammaproteobacteria bacterium]